MAFVQIIDFRSSKMDEGAAHIDEYLKKTEGRRTARRGLLCQDRDDPNHYINIIFFDSAESAEENSNLPETKELSEKMMTVGDGPPTFYNLDVLGDRS